MLELDGTKQRQWDDNMNDNIIDQTAIDKMDKENREYQRQQLKVNCLNAALALRPLNGDGTNELSGDYVLEQAKKFYNFVRT